MPSLDDPLEVGRAMRAQLGYSGLLAELSRFLRRYVVLTEAQLTLVTLWVADTWVLDAASTTAYLYISSAEPESGKTRLLEALELVVARPWQTGKVTAAALVRKVAIDPPPTLLLDESDTAFNSDKEYAAALLGLLNSGYRRSGRATLCVGQGAGLTAALTPDGLAVLRRAQLLHHATVRELYLGRLNEREQRQLARLFEKALPGVVSSAEWPTPRAAP